MCRYSQHFDEIVSSSATSAASAQSEKPGAWNLMLQQIDQTMSDSGILLQSIQFFPNEKSTVWGIYWEDVLFAWRFLKQIQELDVFSYCWGQDL